MTVIILFIVGFIIFAIWFVLVLLLRFVRWLALLSEPPPEPKEVYMEPINVEALPGRVVTQEQSVVDLPIAQTHDTSLPLLDQITQLKNRIPFKWFLIHTRDISGVCLVVQHPTRVWVDNNKCNVSVIIPANWTRDGSERTYTIYVSNIKGVYSVDPFLSSIQGNQFVIHVDDTRTVVLDIKHMLPKDPVEDQRLIVRPTFEIEQQQSLERTRRLAEVEVALRETELREARRKEAEQRLAEAAAWNALILPDAIKLQLLTYCEMLIQHKVYAGQGINIPKGLLLYGPPGCGKTQTARLLSKKAGFFFKSLSSADLKVGFIGQAAVAIQNAFDEARKNAPSVVFIDEIDASCPIRTGGCNSVIDNEVNAQLLQELDGIKTTNERPVFIFAATNRVDLIDPAILERFTERIEISLPTAIERFQLLDNFIKVPFDLSPPENIETELEAHGYSIDSDYGLFTLYGRAKPESMHSENYDKALIEAWEIFMNPDMILSRLATATDCQSGRQIKNMVDKATMKAVRRSCQDGERKPVTLRESDFEP
jgi:SpoVK/Ycf46/Vps4 family AAA+-type ATPase